MQQNGSNADYAELRRVVRITFVVTAELRRVVRIKIVVTLELRRVVRIKIGSYAKFLTPSDIHN